MRVLSQSFFIMIRLNQSIHLFLLSFVIILFFSSCGKSPEANGEALAKRMNECCEQYLSERQQAESDFVTNFYGYNFTSRMAAYEAYSQRMEEVANNYYSRRDEIVEDVSKCAGEYADDYKKLSAFESDYEQNLDDGLDRRVAKKIDDPEVPAAVLVKIRSLVPSKPGEEQIKKDLMTETIGEGFEKEDCWFREDHRWAFKDYKINNFKIDEVIRDTDKEYVAIASMQLESESNAFDARVKISYLLPDLDDWKIEFVNSSGVTIVPTHKYDDLISCEIAEDGWGGTKALYITNKSNIELIVGGEIQTGSKWLRFCKLVKPDDSPSQAGGLFGGGSVDSYRIAFVERP